MTLEEAVTWCTEHDASVLFFRVHGQRRCVVRLAGGFPCEERDTLLEAVEACQNDIRRGSSVVH
jgi:hypothetical protein